MSLVDEEPFFELPWDLETWSVDSPLGGPNFPLIKADSPLGEKPYFKSLLQLDQLSVAIAFTRGNNPKRNMLVLEESSDTVRVYRCTANDTGGTCACPGMLKATKMDIACIVGYTYIWINESVPCECEAKAPFISVDPNLRDWHLSHYNANFFNIEEDNDDKPLPLIEAFRFFNMKGFPVVGFMPMQELQDLGWTASSKPEQQECITTFASQDEPDRKVDPSTCYGLRLQNGTYFAMGIYQFKPIGVEWVVAPPSSAIDKLARHLHEKDPVAATPVAPTLQTLFSKVDFIFDPSDPNFPTVGTHAKSAVQLQQCAKMVLFCRGEDPFRPLQETDLTILETFIEYKCGACGDGSNPCPGRMKIWHISTTDAWIVVESVPCECKVQPPKTEALSVGVDCMTTKKFLTDGHFDKDKTEYWGLVDLIRGYIQQGVPVVGFEEDEVLLANGWEYQRPDPGPNYRPCRPGNDFHSGDDYHPGVFRQRFFGIRLQNGAFFPVGVFQEGPSHHFATGPTADEAINKASKPQEALQQDGEDAGGKQQKELDRLLDAAAVVLPTLDPSKKAEQHLNVLVLFLEMYKKKPQTGESLTPELQELNLDVNKKNNNHNNKKKKNKKKKNNNKKR